MASGSTLQVNSDVVKDMRHTDQPGSGKSWSDIKGEVRSYLGSLRAERMARIARPVKKPADATNARGAVASSSTAPTQTAGGNVVAYQQKLAERSQDSSRQIADLRRARGRKRGAPGGQMKAAEPDLLLSPRGTPKPLPSAPDRDAAVVKHARLPNLRAVAKPPSPEPAVDKQVPRLKPRRVVASPTGAVPEPRTAPAEQPRSRPVEARPGAVKPLASSRDIDDLPSLGPALKAKLRRLNIKTIGELAKQSPDDLRSRLGPAGRLINMDLIIASARSQIK